MNFELLSLSWAQAAATAADALLLLVPTTVPEGDDALTRLAAQARRDQALEEAPGQTLSTWRPAGVQAPRVVLASCGDGHPAQIRKAVQAAMAATRSVERLLLVLPAGTAGPSVQAAALAVAQATYVYTTTLSKPESRRLQTLSVAVTGVQAELQQALAVAQATVAGIEFAKEWANRPANHATPKLLADAAKALVKSAKTTKLHCDVLGPKEVAELGMGAFLAVAQGSTEPLRWIELRYSGASKTRAPVVLVGKGITFDTGGISLKPGAEMDEMKYDMCGAASVLGVFKALAELKPKINVVGLIPACENMPAGNAVKPGDVVTSLSGQTIEILNTDAEGRLILCDALSYAASFKPSAVIDIATLTGACVIALGGVRHGLFSNDDTLAAALQQAGEQGQDPCWRMPLDDDYAEGLKTKFADVANVAGRAGGSVTAAKFLQRFAPEGCPWAHLDIAGTAWKSGAAKGATGRPVALLLHYLLGAAA